MEYIEINLGRILTNIVGLKETEFEIVETTNEVTTKLNLERFGDIDINDKVAPCEDIRNIVSSYIVTTGFEMTYDSMSYNDYVNVMTFRKTVDKIYSDVDNLLSDLYHFESNEVMISVNHDEVKVLLLLISKFDPTGDLEQAREDYKQVCNDIIKDIGNACGFKLDKRIDGEDGWSELIFKR